MTSSWKLKCLVLFADVPAEQGQQRDVQGALHAGGVHRADGLPAGGCQGLLRPGARQACHAQVPSRRLFLVVQNCRPACRQFGCHLIHAACLFAGLQDPSSAQDINLTAAEW